MSSFVGSIQLGKVKVKTYTVIYRKTSFSLPLGADKYAELFPSWVVADLNQNPDQRPKYGTELVPTLTTGCSRIRYKIDDRYLHGSELLLLHGIPVTRQIADVMQCDMVDVAGVSHSAMCKLAGNSMHSASVGFLIMSIFMFVTERS